MRYCASVCFLRSLLLLLYSRLFESSRIMLWYWSYSYSLGIKLPLSWLKREFGELMHKATNVCLILRLPYLKSCVGLINICFLACPTRIRGSI